MTWLRALATLTLCLLAWPGLTAERLIEPFVGSYHNPKEVTLDGYNEADLTAEDYGFTITALRVGFQMTRTRLVPDPDGIERQIEVLDFEPYDTPTLFAGADAGDPVRGRRYYWASVINKTLVVRVQRLLPDGRLELNILRMAPNATGLRMENVILRDGEATRRLAASVERK